VALDQARLIKPAKKLRKLFRKLHRDPTPDEVHDLRTSARRFEAAFKALALDESGVPKSVLKALDHVRKRAGKVRDMDVLTGFAAGVRPHGEEDCHLRLLEHLGARRQKQAGKLRTEVKRLRSPLSKSLDRASSRITKLLDRKDTGPAANAAANAVAAAVRLSAELAAPPRLNKTNLHPYRLKVKELQNVLLMAEGASRPRFVVDLGDVKDAIGEWHDWEEMAGMAAKLPDHGGNCALQAELKRTAETKYHRALSLALKLRKTYLENAEPARKNAASGGIPRAPVWEATARLAG
jgi:CHAD domain-containing protein